MRTEDELIGALRQAAGVVPEPDLLKGIARLRRRRARRRAQALAVAAVVVAVAAGTTVATRISPHRGGGEAAAPVTSTTLPPWPPVKITKGTVEKLWPRALFKMPAKNADGWRYRPITGISATEVLVSAESSFEKAGRLEIYDSETGKARVVTEVPATPGLRRNFMQRTSADGRTVAWYSTASKPDGTRVAELWQAPLAGGDAKLVGTLTGAHADLEAIAVNGDNVFWSTVQGGVWRLPLAGGTPEPIPGGAGLHLIRWPWASDTPMVNMAQDDRNQTKVVDLTTGGYTMAVAMPDGAKDLRCGPFWCDGSRDGATLVQRIDGSARSTLAGVGGQVTAGLSPYPILDRFVQLGNGILDLETGRLASYDNPGDWEGVGTSSEASTIIYWGVTKSDKPDDFWVLNLAAVPPAQ
jgi:hypothetical protein